MKFWPARQKHTADLVADLDAMVSEAIAFKLHGKQHIVKPISLEEFLKYTNAYSQIWNSTDEKKKLTNEQFIEMYHQLFSSVCDTITVDDIKKMSQAQVGALFQLISDTVTGKAHVDQKKTLLRAQTAAMNSSQL